MPLILLFRILIHKKIIQNFLFYIFLIKMKDVIKIKITHHLPFCKLSV